MVNEYKVYCHTTPNGKRYIGMTKLDVEKRWGRGGGYVNCPLFHRAIEKYGWDNIEHTILCWCSSKENAAFLERYFIEKYDTHNPEHGYNLTDGGEGVVGCTWDEERKKRRSKRITGAGNPMYGRNHTKESREKMSRNRKGKENVSPELREFRTRVLIEATQRSRIPIRQLDLDGNVIATYDGMADAARANGFSRGSINNVCLGKADTAYGYKWEYVDEERRKEAAERSKRLDGRTKNKPKNNLEVVQCDLDGNEIARFPSMSEASRQTGVRRNVIADCCHGGLVSYGEFSWHFSGNGSAPDKGEPVIQFDLSGKEIARYDSIDDACKATGMHRSAIINCCHGRATSSQGFGWKYANGRKETRATGAPFKVAQYDLNENLIAEYDSLTEAMRKTGHDRHRINECCRGERESYRDTIWRYLEAPQEVQQPLPGLFY